MLQVKSTKMVERPGALIFNDGSNEQVFFSKPWKKN